MSELSASVTFSRKVNLGNYETADFSVSVHGITPGMGPDDLRAMMDTVHMSWDTIQAEIEEQITSGQGSRATPPSSKAPATPASQSTSALTCVECGADLQQVRFKDGTVWEPAQLAAYGRRKHGRVLCMEHYREANDMIRRSQTLDSIPF